MKERNRQRIYGALTLAEPNETIVGCVLSFQKAGLVYTIVLRGVFFEDAEQVEELFIPIWKRHLPGLQEMPSLKYQVQYRYRRVPRATPYKHMPGLK